MATSNEQFPQQVQRARLSLDGLSIGDAFGQQFFSPGILERCHRAQLPEPPWKYTDDTEMAISIVQTLMELGRIDQDLLAERFAERYRLNPHRGYGAGASQLLEALLGGGDWRQLTCRMFGGAGSFGNGAAMRAAPIGAWFEDVESVIEQATLAAEVTHSHIEGIAGAVAVALGAWWANQRTHAKHDQAPDQLLPWISSLIPVCEVRRRLELAATFDFETWAFDVASQVGSGYEITAQDTVPFCLWLVGANLDNFCEGLWTAARVGGDVDTNCAIVGGILSLSTGPTGIPREWLDSREHLVL